MADTTMGGAGVTQPETPVRVRRETDEPGFWAIGAMVKVRSTLLPDAEPTVQVWYCDPTTYPRLVAPHHPQLCPVASEGYGSTASALMAGWEMHPVQSKVNLQGDERG